jgi:hypothetical protein
MHWWFFCYTPFKDIIIVPLISIYYTWFGNLGWCDTKLNDPICVASLKVAKARTVLVIITGIFLINFANVNNAWGSMNYDLCGSWYIGVKSNSTLPLISISCTCLCNLGWCDTNINDPICVVSPKVAFARSVLVIITGIFIINFTNLITAWGSMNQDLCCSWYIGVKSNSTLPLISISCTYLCNLGWCDTNRNDPICVVAPKVAFARSVLIITGIFIINFAYVNTA